MATATRVMTFAIPAVILVRRPGFELRHLWYLSVATVTLQAFVSVGLLSRAWRQRLAAAAAAPAEPAPVVA